MSMSIMSPAFMPDSEIPLRYTCDGMNASPPIKWSGLPALAKSLVLIVDDPDAPDPAAPQMTWVHWLLYNIPVNVSELAEGVSEKNLPSGTRSGMNDFHLMSYGGLCPPAGRHRYFFKLYALDSVLQDLKSPDKTTLEKAMQGHVLQQASLVGLYQRQSTHQDKQFLSLNG